MELPPHPAIALLDIYPKDTDAVKRKAIYTPVFIAVMATIGKLWKGSRCLSTDEWIKKIWSIYAMEYYLAIRKEESTTFESTWKGLEEIMLIIRCQAEKVNYHMVSYSWGK